MSVQDPRGFNEWLRAQLKAKRMSQRQLAQQAGVDHSTISRLVRGDRTPSLDTATKLARGLREIRDDADSPAYFGQANGTSTNPTARVEYALRADELLSDVHVRQIMDFYLTVRARRMNGGNDNDHALRASMLMRPAGQGSAGALSARRAPQRT